MTVQTNISFRYFGDISDAQGGVITAATRLDRKNEKVYVGICLTPPNCKFDKAFSRSVATYRLSTLLANTPEEFRAAEDTLSVELAAMQGRVRKVFKRVRLSLEDYQQRKAAALASRVGDANINIGYYDYDIQYYTVSDIAISKDYAFSANIETDAKHDEIDTEIIDVLVNNENFLPWVELLLSGDGEDNGDYGKDVEAHNADFNNIKLVQDENGYFLVDAEYAHDNSYTMAISPVKASRDELIEWLDEMLHVVQFTPAIETETETETETEDDASESDYDVDEIEIAEAQAAKEHP